MIGTVSMVLVCALALPMGAVEDRAPAGVTPQATFPPVHRDPDWDALIRLAQRAEDAAKIPGLRDFLVTVAWGESKGYPSAINHDDGIAAVRLTCTDVNQRRYAANEWYPSPCAGPRLGRWAYTGGLLALMPISALHTADRTGHTLDPALVFDARYAFAFGADMVFRLHTHYGAVNFSRARAGWGSPARAGRSIHYQPRLRSHRRFRDDLRETSSRFGVDRHLHRRAVRVSRYPGFAAVLAAMLKEQV